LVRKKLIHRTNRKTHKGNSKRGDEGERVRNKKELGEQKTAFRRIRDKKNHLERELGKKGGGGTS